MTDAGAPNTVELLSQETRQRLMEACSNHHVRWDRVWETYLLRVRRRDASDLAKMFGEDHGAASASAYRRCVADSYRQSPGRRYGGSNMPAILCLPEPQFLRLLAMALEGISNHRANFEPTRTLDLTDVCRDLDAVFESVSAQYATSPSDLTICRRD